MHQSWRELLFLHWDFPPDVIQQTLPRGLTVDTFEDRAWLGIVPFFMRDIRPRWSPCIPGISNFQEVNLRTYVYDEKGTPGVWFFSLDANQRLGVWWGRTLYSLPYHAARMRSVCDRSTGRVSFTSQRRGTPASQTCRYDYQPSGAPRSAQPGTLEFFLVERYVLFAGSSQGVNWSVQVAHAPYEISDVDLRHWDEHLIELSGLPLPGRRPDHACVSRGVKVEVFPLMTLARRAELPTS
jgi:uncharacterized protein YqjF (DUF2071 family)